MPFLGVHTGALAIEQNRAIVRNLIETTLPTLTAGGEPGVIGWRLGLRKGDSSLAAERILYVNYNPGTLIRDEQWLLQAGYEVDTVLGTDGALACRSVGEYAAVLIDEACPLENRKTLIGWLTDNFPGLKILSAAELHKCVTRLRAINQVSS